MEGQNILKEGIETKRNLEMEGFIDTHAHVYLEDFDQDLEEMIERSRSAGINRIFMPNIDKSTIEKMNNLARQYPDYCFPMMGLHPCSVDNAFESSLEVIEKELRTGSYRAVGEIGTDLYWEKKFWEQQKIAFKYQVALAKEINLPVVIHCRESLDQTIGMVEEMKDENLKGIFHCFSGHVEQAERITSLGFLLGIGGVSTFKNGGLDKILPQIGISRLVLETDSPYLAPVPYRGKRNEPSYIPLIANRISNICEVTVDEVLETTTKNANEIFGQ